MAKNLNLLVCKKGNNNFPEKFLVSTPIGSMEVIACRNGLHMICQNEDITDDNFSPQPGSDVVLSEKSEIPEINTHLNDTVKWLQVYFDDVKRIDNVSIPKLCIPSEQGGFRDKVLLTLLKNVRCSEIISYSDLAKLSGSPGAQQAVGSAMSNNPFQLIVPCHRVVKSGNKIGLYSKGRKNSVKVWLLQHEGLSVNNGTVSL